MKNVVFFEPKSWWKDDIYWLLKSSCFDLFGNGKYGLFLSQKVDGKMIFTWSFWAFYDIPGLWKYGFSRGAVRLLYFLPYAAAVNCLVVLFRYHTWSSFHHVLIYFLPKMNWSRKIPNWLNYDHQRFCRVKMGSQYDLTHIS